MNIHKSLEILGFNYEDLDDLDVDEIKSKYRKLALRFHPDKNGNTIESNNKFREINDAYNYLLMYKDISKSDDSSEFNSDNDESNSYFDILNQFMKTSIDKNMYNELLVKVINDILNASTKMSLKILDNLDKNVVLCIYFFLSKYRSILHFSDSLLDELREIIIEKYDCVDIYALNPSIDDILENKFYKLYIKGQLYLVPLWNQESYFEGNDGTEIIVICEPELPENILIDDDNNIHIMKKLDANDIPKMICNENDTIIYISVGSTKLEIPLSSLRIKKEQTYTFKNRGISENSHKNLYSINKGDIIVHILFI